MNKRFLELATQAGLYDEKTPEEVPGFTACFEKFAELIVQDCLELCRKEMADNDVAVANARSLESETLFSMAYGCQAQAEKIHNMIAKHFGDEE